MKINKCVKESFVVIGKEGSTLDEKVCREVRLVDNILRAEDFVRLRIATGFAEIPVEHAQKALQNGLLNVSAIYKDELVGWGDWLETALCTGIFRK